MLDKSIQIKGKKNIYAGRDISAGRDIIINDSELSNAITELSELYNTSLKKAFNELDERIISFFPDGLTSSTSPDSPIIFSSERLFTSLTLLGLPIDIALYAISRTEVEFSKLCENQKKITTDDIRRAVAKALYQYDSICYNQKKQKFWADKYVRIYGRPNQQLVVIQKDGSFDELTYKYILKILIPHLVESIWGLGKFECLRKIISKDEKHEIAEEILKSVKSLGIYRIHYSSLLCISKELALQPPHPWIVEKAFDYSSIVYDYEKAEKHSFNMMNYYAKQNYESCLYSYRETIHHSCSAMLAYYGIYMGCGYLAPLHTLYRLIVNLEKGNAIEASSCENIDLKSDLKNLGISITEFSRCIKLLREQLNISGELEDQEIKLSIDLAKELFEICSRLLCDYFILYDLRNSSLQGINDKKSLIEAAQAAFRIVPGFQISVDKRERTWLIHNAPLSIFRDIKTRILLAPIFKKSSELTPSDLDLFCDDISNRQISNCIFYVSNNDFTYSCEEYREILIEKGIIPFFITIEELIETAVSENSLEHLEFYLMYDFL